MSEIEITVILFGLFLGYWVVAKFIGVTPKKVEQAPPEPESQYESTKEQEPQSWHEILNVSPHAPIDEIRRAYKALMSQYHPDKVASLGEELKALAEKKSKEITSAYRNAMQQRGVDV